MISFETFLYKKKKTKQLLASRLNERNLLESDVRVCHFRTRNNVLKSFFRVDGPMVFCHDISGLFKVLKQEYNASDWRLFVDFSQRSLKTALVHNGNFKPIPIAHFAHVKETYYNMKVLPEVVQCNVHLWNIC